jgi:predicted DNA-binding transcriptional regulator YafY
MMRVDRLLSILLIMSNKGLVTEKELAEHFIKRSTSNEEINKIFDTAIKKMELGSN